MYHVHTLMLKPVAVVMTVRQMCNTAHRLDLASCISFHTAICMAHSCLSVNLVLMFPRLLDAYSLSFVKASVHVGPNPVQVLQSALYLFLVCSPVFVYS